MSEVSGMAVFILERCYSWTTTPKDEIHLLLLQEGFVRWFRCGARRTIGYSELGQFMLEEVGDLRVNVFLHSTIDRFIDGITDITCPKNHVLEVLVDVGSGIVFRVDLFGEH
jgi:hypothetical protein